MEPAVAHGVCRGFRIEPFAQGSLRDLGLEAVEWKSYLGSERARGLCRLGLRGLLSEVRGVNYRVHDEACTPWVGVARAGLGLEWYSKRRRGLCTFGHARLKA